LSFGGNMYLTKRQNKWIPKTGIRKAIDISLIEVACLAVVSAPLALIVILI